MEITVPIPNPPHERLLKIKAEVNWGKNSFLHDGTRVKPLAVAWSPRDEGDRSEDPWEFYEERQDEVDEKIIRKREKKLKR